MELGSCWLHSSDPWDANAGRGPCDMRSEMRPHDIDDCRFQYGNDPADADALADCIQEAKDDHQNCLGDCANRAISPPSRWRLAGSTLIVRCRGPARNRASQIRAEGNHDRQTSLNYARSSSDRQFASRRGIGTNIRKGSHDRRCCSLPGATGAGVDAG